MLVDVVDSIMLAHGSTVCVGGWEILTAIFLAVVRDKPRDERRDRRHRSRPCRREEGGGEGGSQDCVGSQGCGGKSDEEELHGGCCMVGIVWYDVMM